MYKILVIDEEMMVIDSLKKIINYNLNEANVVGYANTGRDAVEKAKKIKPDIIIIEVKLSCFNGFDTIDLIKKIVPKVHVVILSAYDNFDFAREAIALSVDDYLLKPINKTVLIHSLKRVIHMIKEDKQNKEDETERNLFIDNTVEFVEYSFIYSILFKGNSNEDILRYKKLLNLSDHGYIMNIELINSDDYRSASENKLESKYECLKKVISKYHRSIIGPQILNRIVIFILDDDIDTNSDKQKVESTELANIITMKLKKVYNVDAMIGIGNSYDISNMHLSYDEAIKSLHYGYSNNSPIHIRDLGKKTQINYMNYYDIEQRLLESIKLNKNKSLDLFAILLDMLTTLKVDDRKNKIMELLVIASYTMHNLSQNEEQFINYSRYFEEIQEIKDNEIASWALSKFQYILKSMRVSKEDKMSNITSMAIKYIEEHYNEEISLYDVSKYVSVTPQYFSKLFKDETGYNFVEWITNTRVKKAKDLMNNKDKTIKEVCYMVGYHDPNYFSRIFKKIVGVSPTDYMKGKEKSN